MQKVNVQDFSDLVKYASEEYCGRNMNGELRIEGKTSQRFGMLVANISMVTAEKNRLYARKYEITDIQGNDIVRFIFGHATMLFSSSTLKFREELLAENEIEGVITLKQSVFRQVTIPAAVIILSNEKKQTWLTAVDNFDTFIGMLLSKLPDGQKIYYTDKLSAENMLPEYYNGDAEEIAKSFNDNETRKLEDVAEVINGRSAKQDDYAEEGLPYLRARDIQNGKIVLPSVYINVDKVSAFSRQLVQEGDILLTKNFGQNKLTMVTEDDVPAIASNGLFIIRPYNVSEKYLYRYLTSKTGNAAFNKQITRIQKGVTIPSIALKDLICVLVPIYDEQTMQDIENMDSINLTEAANAAKRLVKNTISETQLEKEVISKLEEAGWTKGMMLPEKDAWVSIGKDRRWRPDFVYLLPDRRHVYIEIKTDLTHIRPEWIEAMKQLLYGDENCFFILTTGIYYEIHVAGVECSLKLLQPPTVDELLNWEKEVR